MRHFWCAAAAARRPSGRELGWSATLSIDDPVDIIADDDEIVIRRQRPRVTMDELLARFDPASHWHDLNLDDAPIGNETPRMSYAPERGDIILIEMSPQAGSEMAGLHHALVLSEQRFSVAIRWIVACPIITKNKGC
jgi:hypothetical protein